MVGEGLGTRWYDGSVLECNHNCQLLSFCVRIFSEKGLPYLEKEFPRLKFKGKGHEVSLHGWEDSLYKELNLLNNTPSLSFFRVFVCPDSPRSIIVLKWCMLGRNLGIEIASSRHCCFDWQASDLKYLLQQYEHWANTLFPKLTFKDVTDRIESLASKKSFKVN